MSRAITGKDFKFFHGPNKAILELKNQKWVQKSTIFDHIDIHVLAILGVQKFQSKFDSLLTCEMVIFEHFGVKKVVFLTFSKLYKTCLGSI